MALLLRAGAVDADSLADLGKPSSSIAGCVNDWGPLGTGAGVGSTCEGRATRAAWTEHEAAVAVARDTLLSASNWPDKVDPLAVVNALEAAAGAADAMARLYHAPEPRPGDFADVLGWMRPWFERRKLPVPASIGDGFRTIKGALDRPVLHRQDRKALLDDAALFATRESELAAELAADMERQTDAAVRAAHRAAVLAAEAAERGERPAGAGAAIAREAGPGFQAIAQDQASRLDQSLAAHPNQGGYGARTDRAMAAMLAGFLWVAGFALIVVAIGFRGLLARFGVRRAVGFSALFLLALPVSWLPIALLHALTGWPGRGVFGVVAWFALLAVLLVGGPRLLTDRFGRAWASLFAARPTLHGSARFGTAEDAAGHFPPAVAADAFLLGELPGTTREGHRRFGQDGHILTCAPTGAGKGIGAVIPNLLTYPGSAFVLDLKGENYAVTARARRQAGQDVYLIDPFGITGAAGQAMNWLDALDPDSADVVSLSGALAELLVVSAGSESEPHWNDTARELLRGLLVYVASLPPKRRRMAELRRILTASEDDLAAVLADMMADPELGQRLPARAAAAHVNRPERERGSVLSTAVRHTAWLDDPRLSTVLAQSDFELRDLKRRAMTVYLAIPPDRLRACLGFVRGFIGLALDAVTATQGQPQARVAFFLDEFGQLGRMDRLADSITLLRGYGAQLWLFVQDLSQLRAVYPRWQSFLANTTQQVFGTADYDTARYVSDALGHQTISFETRSRTFHPGHGLTSGTVSAGQGEHLAGRALLTPDEVMRLGPTRPIVMTAGEPPYLLNRINYLTDPVYDGRFDPNPMHREVAAA